MGFKYINQGKHLKKACIDKCWGCGGCGGPYYPEVESVEINVYKAAYTLISYTFYKTQN